MSDMEGGGYFIDSSSPRFLLFDTTCTPHFCHSALLLEIGSLLLEISSSDLESFALRLRCSTSASIFFALRLCDDRIFDFWAALIVGVWLFRRILRVVTGFGFVT